MSVGVYCSRSNFWRHVAPIADTLRGRGHDVQVWSRDGDFAPALHLRDRQKAGLTVVASWDDAQLFVEKPVVYVEHGAGQSYEGVTGHGYSGASGLDHVLLFLAPGEPVAARWRARYPQAVVEAVGCPALDVHCHEGEALAGTDDGSLRRPVVAFSWRWRCSITQETMPALPHYEQALDEVGAALACEAITVVGHGHPRAYGPHKRLWERVGVPYETDPDVVLASASLLVVDNSSIAYEAAALDVPVLSLNAPWYRKNVIHGLRFWSHVPGLQCDDPERLYDLIHDALEDPPIARALRHRAATHVYAHADSQAADRAADAIERLMR